VRTGIELALFPCEASTRQQWRFDGNQTLHLSRLAADTETAKNSLKDLCVQGGDDYRPYLKLTECDENQNLLLRLEPNGSGQLVDSWSGLCVTLSEGSTAAGALVQLAPCVEDGSAVEQLWTVFPATGEVKSAATEYCVTAGWPFLYAAAFVTPEENTAVVVVNEAPVDATLSVEDSRFGSFQSGINAHSIQTLVY